MKPNVAVVYGGFSSEREISIASGKYVASVIDKEKFNVYRVNISKKHWLVNDTYEIKRDDFSFVIDNKKIKFDIAVIVIHGNPGENGILQSYFDLINLPYVSCNTLGASLTFNKFYCNQYLKNFDINIANSIILRKGEVIEPYQIINKLGLPVFVKPNAGGSSFGTTKVKNANHLQQAIELAFNESDEVIIESFIKGREITVGVLKIENKITALTPCEVRSKHEFFDYEAKYNPDLNEEIIPAPITPGQLSQAKKLAQKIYQLINCSGIVRIDFILSEQQNKFYFLELNSIPGMTSASIVPKMLGYDKLDITEVYTQLILEKLESH